MKEDGEYMPTKMEQSNMAKIENASPNQNRILASDLRHSKRRQDLLQSNETVEVISAGETVAQLSKPNLIPDLINKINMLEQEMEQLKIEHLYSNRLHEKSLLSGVALEDATTALLDHYLKTGEIK